MAFRYGTHPFIPNGRLSTQVCNDASSQNLTLTFDCSRIQPGCIMTFPSLCHSTGTQNQPSRSVRTGQNPGDLKNNLLYNLAEMPYVTKVVHEGWNTQKCFKAQILDTNLNGAPLGHFPSDVAALNFQVRHVRRAVRGPVNVQ